MTFCHCLFRSKPKQNTKTRLHSDHSGYGRSQWQMTSHCNVVSHWLSPYPDWSQRAYFIGIPVIALVFVYGSLAREFCHFDKTCMTGCTIKWPNVTKIQILSKWRHFRFYDDNVRFYYNDLYNQEHISWQYCVTKFGNQSTLNFNWFTIFFEILLIILQYCADLWRAYDTDKLWNNDIRLGFISPLLKNQSLAQSKWWLIVVLWCNKSEYKSSINTSNYDVDNSPWTTVRSVAVKSNLRYWKPSKHMLNVLCLNTNVYDSKNCLME